MVQLDLSALVVLSGRMLLLICEPHESGDRRLFRFRGV